MQYLLARDGQQLGQFSEEEIRTGLFEGRFHPTDAAWTEGMGDWRPIGEILGQGVARIAKARRAVEAGKEPRYVPSRATGITIAALVLVGVGLFAALSMGAFGNMKEKKQFSQGLATARELVLAVRRHAADKGGKYPATLEELVASSGITQVQHDQARSFKPEGWLGEPGFEYFGAELNDSMDGGKPLLRSRCWSPGGKRIVVTNDTSIELEKVPSPK